MKKGFWKKLEKPIFALAPMADVTDAAFRRMFSRYGPPDITWTEFVSADGLFLAPEEDQRPINLPEKLREVVEKHRVAPNNPLLKDLIYTEGERPIVAQFFSRDPERMKKAAALAVELGFDGVDINMGCPAKIIVNQGAGCAMIREPDVAREVIRACKEGASGKIPVSVKTRTGFNTNEIETWLPKILKEEPAAVIMHARTRKDMSKVPAQWDVIKRAVEIRDGVSPKALLLGNGDIDNLSDALKRVKESGCDGVMIARGIFGDPEFFAGAEKAREDFKNCRIGGVGDYHRERSREERFKQLLEHAELFEELLGDAKPFHIMRKHFKAYVSDFPGASTLRGKLMRCENTTEVRDILEKEENLANTLKSKDFLSPHFP